MPFVHMRGAGFKPRKEGGKAACGRKPVQGGERKGHEAEKAGEQGQMLCHADACVAEERAGANGCSIRPPAERLAGKLIP